jgi:hypothetical protein
VELIENDKEFPVRAAAPAKNCIPSFYCRLTLAHFGRPRRALNLARFAWRRQSVGGRLTLWSATKVVFRAYVGFGSGEGRHSFVGILQRPGPVATPYRTY